jgi:putative isomerase
MGWEMDRIFQSNKFRVKDVLFNSIYAQNLSSLSRLCQIVGDEEAKFFHNRALGVEEGILSKMYDEETGLFYSLDARFGQDKQIKVNTISSLMPLILDNLGQAQVERLVSEHLLNPEEYWLRYPLPAVPLNSYDADVEDHIIWRGLQTWIYPNWYLVLGLRKQAQRFPEHFQEYNRIADEITLRTYDLVQSEGLCDFYHSQSGKGAAPQFSWSSLVLDMVHGACSTPGVSTDQ